MSRLEFYDPFRGWVRRTLSEGCSEFVIDFTVTLACRSLRICSIYTRKLQTDVILSRIRDDISIFGAVPIGGKVAVSHESELSA